MGSFKQYCVSDSSDDEKTKSNNKKSPENKAKSSPAHASSPKNVRTFDELVILNEI